MSSAKIVKCKHCGSHIPDSGVKVAAKQMVSQKFAHWGGVENIFYQKVTYNCPNHLNCGKSTTEKEKKSSWYYK